MRQPSISSTFGLTMQLAQTKPPASSRAPEKVEKDEARPGPPQRAVERFEKEPVID